MTDASTYNVDVQNPVATIGLLNGLLVKINDQVKQIDTQSNIIIAFNSAIFIFSAQLSIRNVGTVDWYLLTLATFSAVSAMFGMLAIHPPAYMRKHGQHESIIYHGSVYDFKDAALYSKELAQICNISSTTISEYGLEIYNLVKYYYKPKRLLFHRARSTILVGFFVSLVLYLFQFVFKVF